MQKSWIIKIFCNSQSNINNLRECNVNAHQWLKLQVYQKTQKLVKQGHSVSIRWVLVHGTVERNERVDKAIKKATLGKRVYTAKWTSLTHIKQRIIEEKNPQISIWYNKKRRNEEKIDGAFILHLSYHRFIDSWARRKSFTHHGFIKWRLEKLQ